MSDEPFIVSDDDSATDDDETARRSLEAHQSMAEDRLNERHVRAVFLERKALIRRRTYFIVAGITCGVAALELGLMSLNLFHTGSGARAGVAALLVPCFGWMAFQLFYAAKQIRVDPSHRNLPAPSDADFSTLSDGSQIVENLNNLRDS